MTHQLDFHVTLWSDNPDILLATELQLNALVNAVPGWEIVTLSNIIDNSMGHISKAEVHSVDINWDDVDIKPYWECPYDVEEED